MAINKETIHELVEVFYQPPFKTFYINSSDGETFIRPLGVFVSLGITTSLRVLQDIRDVLSKSSGLSARLAEIRSQKIAGQFLNYIVPKKESDIVQYNMADFPDFCMDEETAKDLLKRMKEKMTSSGETDVTSLYDYCPKISKLSELIDKLNSNPVGWKDHMIQETPEGEYRIFHKKVNYQRSKTDGSEYRIGIYVTEL